MASGRWGRRIPRSRSAPFQSLRENFPEKSMLRSWRALRWGALFVVLAVEALEFLFIDPTNRLGARTWTWMGWTAFTFFWLFLELSLLFHNQGRIRRELVLNEQ